MIEETAILARYAVIKDQLDERGPRLFVAAGKAAAGYGGTAAVSRATGVARSMIIRGAKDLLAVSSATLRVRRAGAGRPASSMADPTVLVGLRGLHHAVSANTVAKMLTVLGYSRQVSRKTKDAGADYRLGERRKRSRYRGFRGKLDPPLV